MGKIFTDHGDYIELNEPIGGIKMITKIAGEMSWNTAVAYSKESKIGGFSDWRLPTKEELKQLSQIEEICVVIVSFHSTFWSSSAEKCRSDCRWVVGFIEKNDEGPSCVDSKHYVFFVR